MNNNLEFENEDPSPDSIEDNHPRTNYGEGYGGKETLEEAAENYAKPFDNRFWVVATFKDGAKYQEERMYSEEEVLKLLQKALTHRDNGETGNLITAQGEIRTANFYSWFEQNKKK